MLDDNPKTVITGWTVTPGKRQPKPFQQNCKWRVVKITFSFVFVVCAISSHYWCFSYALTLSRIKNYFAISFFVLKCTMLAVTMDYLILKRKRISAMVEFFEETANKQNYTFLVTKRNKILIVVVNVCVVSYIVVGSLHIFQLDDKSRDKTVSTLSFGHEKQLSPGVKTFILLLDAGMYHLNGMLLILWLPLAYGLLVQVILNEVAILKDNISRTKSSLPLELLLQQTERSTRKIRKLVSLVNKCLGSTVLVWSGSALIAICEGITQFCDVLQSQYKLVSLTGYFVYFVPTLALMVLSAGLCTKVTSEMMVVMELLQNLSQIAGREGLASQLHLLLYRLSVPELAMTGGGCYAINRQFCLSYFCLVTTYSAIVTQLQR